MLSHRLTTKATGICGAFDTLRNRGYCATIIKEYPPMPSKLTASPLLALPAELREQIYSYVLGKNYFHVTQNGAGVRLCRRPHRFRLRQDIIKSSPIRQMFTPAFASHEECYIDRKDRYVSSGMSCALLLVCRQVYNEAALLLFSANTFVFSRCHVIENFLLAHSEERRLALREVILQQLIDVDHLSFELASGLRRITIFALLYNREEYRPSHSHLKTFELLSQQLGHLKGVSVCLEYFSSSRTKDWDYRKAEADVEGFLMREAALSQTTTKLLD